MLFNYSVNLEKFLQPFFLGQNITIPITPFQNQKKRKHKRVKLAYELEFVY